jgi:transposase
MPPHKSEDYKISAVQYYLSKNNNQVQTCEIFQCHPRSLMRWVDKYNKNKKITRKKKLPKAYKIKKEQVDYILKILNDDRTITMNDMLQKVKEKYSDFDITSRHISNIVRDNNITLKLTRFRHEPTKRFGKDININKNIKLFYEKVKQYKIDDIICIDETSIKSLQKRKFCYSRKVRDVLLKHIHKKYLRNILGFLLYLQKVY